MLKGYKLTVHHFAINYNRFEVAKLVLKLAFLVLSSEKVDPILDQITLHKQSKLERSRSEYHPCNRTYLSSQLLRLIAQRGPIIDF